MNDNKFSLMDAIAFGCKIGIGLFAARLTITVLDGAADGFCKALNAVEQKSDKSETETTV